MRIIRPISLYNTLTRKIEPISPVTPGEVKIYSCGPTVYNFAHIGNLRTFLFQDLMKRTLLAAGYQVRHCMNITDVEDNSICSVEISTRSICISTITIHYNQTTQRAIHRHCIYC